MLDKLISIDDDILFEKISDFIGSVDNNKTVFKTTDAQKKMLAKSEDDIRNGNLISDAEVNEEEDRWLNK